MAQLEFGSLSRETIHATRRGLLDAVGVSLAATALSPECIPFRTLALTAAGAGTSRLLGSGARAAPDSAAFANGALAHALDYGDVFDAGPVHPNAALVPALLALADARAPIDASQFLTAMTAGSDLACRLSVSPARRFEDGGWYPPPLVGMIGAAAACGKLLGLAEDGVLAAMGLVLCQASFPGQIKYDQGTQIRAVREAFAARAAVTAALLAAHGVHGFEQPLEGKAGFFAIHSGGFDCELLLKGLGSRFYGDELTFKPWPCCRGTHAYIEAALTLRQRIGDAYAEVASLEAEVGPVQAMLIEPIERKVRPESAIDAKFSIPFTVAVALARGEVTLDSFGAEARSDQGILDLAKKVVPKVSQAKNFSPAAGALTATLRHGEKHRVDVPEASGGPSRPVSDDQLIEKFVDCASRAAKSLHEGAARRLADRILNLEPSDRIDDLAIY